MHGGWFSAVYHPGVDLLDYIHDERYSDRPVPAMVSTLVIGDTLAGSRSIPITSVLRPPAMPSTVRIPRPLIHPLHGLHLVPVIVRLVVSGDTQCDLEVNRPSSPATSLVSGINRWTGNCARGTRRGGGFAMALRSTLSLPDFDLTLYDRASPNEHICSAGN